MTIEGRGIAGSRRAPEGTRRCIWTAALVCGGGIAAGPALGQCGDGPEGGLDKVLANDGNGSEQFAAAVAVSGPVAVFGAYQDNDNGTSSGSAYVRRWNGSTWVQEQKLLASDGGPHDKFGFAVAVSGNVVLIGSYGDDDRGNGAGAAYVFRFNGSTWVQEQKLTASDGASGDNFGAALALSGNVAVIGSYDDAMGYFAGAAYVFRYNGSTWVQEQKLVASDGGNSDFFGSAMGVSGNLAIIGAPGVDDSGWDAGAAYAFRYTGSTWVQEHKFLAADGAPHDKYGTAVGADGALVVVGAFNDGSSQNGTLNGSGSAYTYRRTGSAWVAETKLLASDGAPQDHFGRSVAISGQRVLAGAHLDDDNGSSSGSAYVFERSGTTWFQVEKLVPDDGAFGDTFGCSVAVSGEVVAVGANLDDDNGSDAGAAYLAGTGSNQGSPVEDCNDNGVDDACDIEEGDSPDLDGNGVPDECQIVIGDVNGDGVVTVVDLILLMGDWGTCLGLCPADFNLDGVVDVLDLVALMEAWN